MNQEPAAAAAEQASATAPPPHRVPEPSPARDLSLHVLRMLETRMDAAGIALQGEIELRMKRVRLRAIAGAALFFAVWAGIVLLAIALPEDQRIPVLSGVVAALVMLGVVALRMAKRQAAAQEVGSLRWLLDSLRQDLEVLSNSLSQKAEPRPSPQRSAPDELAA